MPKYAVILMILACFAVAATGCNRGEEEKKDESPANVVEAVGNYLGDTVQKKSESRNQMGMMQVRQRIRNFWGANGRYPRDLGELQNSTGPLPNPGRGFHYQYDPATGNITVVKVR
jgi:hypothetical protein